MQNVITVFKKHPVLSLMSFVFSIFVISLMALVVVLTVSPQSQIGNMVENLF